MKMLSNFKDSLSSTDFSIYSSMKVQELCNQFKKKFRLSLRVYKGMQIVSDGRTTLKVLDERTSTSIKFDAKKITIKANMKVGHVEQIFREHLGLVVQVADEKNAYLVDNNLTLGNAVRADKLK